jgi:Glycosyl hydrolase catalytic core
VLLPACRRVRLTYRRHLLHAFVAIAASAVLPAIVAGTGVTAILTNPIPEFGIVAFDLNDPVPDLLTRLGVGVVRGSCDWPVLEPSHGVFRWDCADNLIVRAEQLGLFSYMTVACTPPWANGGAGCATMPDTVADWYEFVQAFVARYSRYHATLGVWNEPNLTLRDTADGVNYALLFVNASIARNSINPQFALAGPETSHHALASGYYVRTMDRIQAARALNPADVVAVHWYPDGPRLRDYIDAVSAPGLAGTNDVWLTEVGIATADPARQAAFYRMVLDVFGANENPRWSHVIFYRLWDGRVCCSESIVNPDFTPKPAFHVLRFAIDRFRADRRQRQRLDRSIG